MGGPQRKLRVLVVGSHSRKVGKTALMVDLIRAFPEAAWTAVKITPHEPGESSGEEENWGRAPAEQTFALEEEHDCSSRTDTSRFLCAGAARALWLHTQPGHLADAMAVLRAELGAGRNVLIESNAVLQFLRPELYVVVLDPAQPGFKQSSIRFLDRTDAFLLRSPLTVGGWPGVSKRLLEEKPCFQQPLGQPLPEGLARLVRERFFPPTSVLDRDE